MIPFLVIGKAGIAYVNTEDQTGNGLWVTLLSSHPTGEIPDFSQILLTSKKLGQDIYFHPPYYRVPNNLSNLRSRVWIISQLAQVPSPLWRDQESTDVPAAETGLCLPRTPAWPLLGRPQKSSSKPSSEKQTPPPHHTPPHLLPPSENKLQYCSVHRTQGDFILKGFCLFFSDSTRAPFIKERMAFKLGYLKHKHLRIQMLQTFPIHTAFI